MCLDIKNFYLTAPIDWFEYMKMPLSLFPSWTKEQYNLDRLAKNRFVYLEMRRAVWGLPQAGILANKLLRKQLLPHGYYECKHTPGLWRHLTCPISFTLVVNDFGVKYVGREHANHLIKCIKEKYELTEDCILRDQVALGLQSTHPRHINAGVYQKAPPKIQA
jgi:hypothetical protein